LGRVEVAELCMHMLHFDLANMFELFLSEHKSGELDFVFKTPNLRPVCY